MNAHLLQTGMEFKNYHVLCEFLDVPIKVGRAKQLQVQDFHRYFDYDKQGHKITITEIYSTPKPKKDSRRWEYATLPNIEDGLVTEEELVKRYGTAAQYASYKKHGHFIGGYKKAFFKNLSKYCEVTAMDNRVYRIDQIIDFVEKTKPKKKVKFKKPKKKVKSTKKTVKQTKQVEAMEQNLPHNFSKMKRALHQYSIPLLLHYLIIHNSESVAIDYTIGRWVKEIGVVNDNYEIMRNSSFLAKNELDSIVAGTLTKDFINRIANMMRNCLLKSFQYLQDAQLVENSEVWYCVIPNEEKTFTIRKATEEDMKIYRQCERIADAVADITELCERYYGHKSSLFNKTLKRELKKRRYKRFYKHYELHCINTEVCLTILGQFYEKTPETLAREFGEALATKFISNTVRRVNKLDTGIPVEEYITCFQTLCDLIFNPQAKTLKYEKHSKYLPLSNKTNDK